MRLATRILFGLSGFLLLAAVVYWTMSYTGTARSRDPAGPALLAVAAVGFGYTGLVLWAAARRADREAAAEHAAPGAERATVVHVPPTIWPFGFSIAALALVLVQGLGGQLTHAHHDSMEAGSIYWHFVDVVWICLFTTFYVVGLH